MAITLVTMRGTMRMPGFGRDVHSTNVESARLRSNPPDRFSEDLRVAAGLLLALMMATPFWILVGFLLYRSVS